MLLSLLKSLILAGLLITFVPNHLKTKKMQKYAVKKLPYLLKHVSDQYNNQQMCAKSIIENGGTLQSVSDC